MHMCPILPPLTHNDSQPANHPWWNKTFSYQINCNCNSLSPSRRVCKSAPAGSSHSYYTPCARLQLWHGRRKFKWSSFAVAPLEWPRPLFSRRRGHKTPPRSLCVCVSSAALETPEKLRFPLGLVFTPGFSNLKAAFLPADFSQFVEKIRQSLFSSWAGVCVFECEFVFVCGW